METQLLEQIAPKLSISSEMIKKKACELMRLIDVRASSGVLTVLKPSGACKAVICLELAASKASCSVDRTQAICVSGMTKKMYLQCYRAFQSVLDGETKVTIPELCTQLGCVHAKSLALQLMSKFVASQTGEPSTYDRPLYTTTCTYAAARKLRTKVDKSKVVEMSGVKNNVFERQVATFEKVLETMSKEQASESRTNSGKVNIYENIEKLADNTNIYNEEKSVDDDSSNANQESYEVWKQRILKNARQALKQS